MRVRVSSAWREVARARVRIGASWRNVVRVRQYIGGAWKEIAAFIPPISVTITPETIAETLGSSSAIMVTTNEATATPTGGIGPYTYSWTRISGTSAVVNNPFSAVTTFTRLVDPGLTFTETFRCTVTDSAGNFGTADTLVTFGNTGIDGLNNVPLF